ncbi:MAG: 50S ribosomal protein L22 [Bacteroidia bacterium]|jgi:large subunit ribosomal protein L22
MSVRKHNAAEARKEARKSQYIAKLNNCPTSPRKMRLVADMVRGKSVNEALALLKFSSKEASIRLEKLVKSAVANYLQKNEGARLDDANLFVSTIFVDSATMLKRLRTAPQGRGYRVRKRSNHVTVILGQK